MCPFVLQYKWVMKMICPRCLNEDPQYFYQIQDRYYCRKCIHYGHQETSIQLTYPKQNVDYHLQYELTKEQKRIAFQILKRYQNKKDTVVKSVTGSGKTEMIYPVIKYALNQGHKVCFTTPRKALTQELAMRIEKQFTSIKPVIVYGGHSKQVDGQFIICTTHQLFRYRHCFDLLILDEFDAFPYAGNNELQAMLKTSIKGHYVMMSATNQESDLLLKRRYHGHDLPVPKSIVVPDIFSYFMMMKLLKRYRASKKPVLIFVPTIKDIKPVVKFLKVMGFKVYGVSSQTENIKHHLELLKENLYDALITTTILERGMTVKNVQVIVMKGAHPIYDCPTLIQIAGRVGRVVPFNEGEVIILSYFKTKEIRQCIKEIKALNA